LIVDDEVHIAGGIKDSVEWDKFRIAGVRVAYSVRQAKEMIGSSSVDIVICDIEMPEEDGFELLNWINRHYPATQFVFLTCHASFDFAQKAIQLGSLDYILKPVLPATLEKMIVKAMDGIAKYRETSQLQENFIHYQGLWSAHLPLLIERFWQDLVNDRIPNQLEAIEERIRAVSKSYRGDASYLPVLMSIRKWTKNLSVRESHILGYALRKAAEETILSGGRIGHVVAVNPNTLLAVITEPDGTGPDRETLRQDCENYIDACQRYFYCNLNCYIGEAGHIREIKDGYTKLLELDRRNVSSNDNRVWLYQEQVHREQDKTIHSPDLSLWSRLLICYNKAKLQQEISDYLDSIGTLEGLDRDWLYIFYQDFLQVVHMALKQKGLKAHLVLNNILSLEHSLVATRSLSDLKQCVLEIADKVVNVIQELELKLTLSDRVKQYVAQNINRDFSRQDLAEHLGLTTDYITKLFKKETGTSIADYIVEERINSARTLLAKTEMPVSDIALLVSYNNFSYFAKIFKKMTGCTPVEYRKIHSA